VFCQAVAIAEPPRSRPAKTWQDLQLFDDLVALNKCMGLITGKLQLPATPSQLPAAECFAAMTCFDQPHLLSVITGHSSLMHEC